MSLIIDLENIRKNIKLIKEITKKELMVVQKSNAYELNSQKIIPLLKEEKIKWIVYNKYIEYLKDKEEEWYKIPDNVVGVIVDPISGKIATENTKKKLTYYIKGTEPKVDNKTLDDAIPTIKEE